MVIDVLEKVIGFEWDEGNIEHIEEHDVTPDEAEEVFSDTDNLLDEDI